MRPFYENRDRAIQAYEAFDLEFPEHLHDHVEVLLVLAGSMEVNVMERCQELKPGECAVIFPQQIHSYRRPSGSCARLFIFDGSLTGMYLHPVRKYIPTHPFLSSDELSEDGRLALDRIYRLSCVRQESAEASAAQESPANTEDLCSAWLQVLFALIWSRLMPEKRNNAEGMERTCQIVQYVTEHFQEPLSLDLIARELHLNKSYVSHIFSSQLRISFRRYLSHVRLEYALLLIRTSSAPLVDICLEAGFSSLRSFNRAFVEITGMTPREYRKSVAAKS